MIKKLMALVMGSLLAVQVASAQTETGTSTGAQAMDTARSEEGSAGRASTTQTEVVGAVVTDGKSTKAVVVEEEVEKWWSITASTGWDSLYMFRGVNVLGNGNGIYWVGGSATVNPWTDGAITAGVWYGVGSWWNGANTHAPYGELDVYAEYAHTFGDLTLKAGWIYYYYPNVPAAAGGPNSSQNEIYFGASYNIEIGSVTLTPNTAFYYNVGPEIGKPGGIVNGGSSYWNLGLNATIPVAFDGAVSLAPYSMFGINFGFNNKDGGATRYNGGNNWQSGIALPVAFTSWLTVSPYIAYSYQWNNFIAGAGSGTGLTDENTWWAGVSATVAF